MVQPLVLFKYTTDSGSVDVACDGCKALEISTSNVELTFINFHASVNEPRVVNTATDVTTGRNLELPRVGEQLKSLILAGNRTNDFEGIDNLFLQSGLNQRGTPVETNVTVHDTLSVTTSDVGIC
jgi:hypothetical protein